MRPGNLLHNELIEFAQLLFGGDWRDELAKELKISRKQLVLTLAAGDPVPEEITVPMVALIENHLEKRMSELKELRIRVEAMRDGNTQNQQLQTLRRSAS